MSTTILCPSEQVSHHKESSSQSQLLVCKHRTTKNTCRQHSTNLSVHTMASRIVLVVLFNLLLVSPIYCQDDSSQNTTAKPDAAPIKQEQKAQNITFSAPKSLNFADCYARVDNGRQAAYICLEKQELLPLLIFAEEEAKKICQRDFKNDHWNCTDFSILKEPKITRGQVYQESAYVYALSMAVIAHTVTEACALGELESCTCNEGPTSIEGDVTKKHCSDEYGLQVAENFLRLRKSKPGKDLKDELFDHNVEAAKKVIRASVQGENTQCTCHGVSGTCTVQTCYSELTDIDTIAFKIREKYDTACQVDSNGASVNGWIPKKGVCSSFTETDLIFRGEFNWCEPNPILGSTGVVGRECKPPGEGEVEDGPDSCQQICRRCDKHSVKVTQLVREESNCRFRFCCDITCEVVESEKSIHICA